MPYGTPLTEQQRTARHQSIYGTDPPPARALQHQTTGVGTTDENETLIMVVGGIAAVWIFIEFVLPNIWKKD